MISGKTISKGLLLLVTQLFFNHFISAQTDELKPDAYDLKHLNKDSNLNISLFENQLFQNGIFFNPLNSFMNNDNPDFLFKERKQFRNFSFSQDLNTSFLPGMGVYEHFNNYFRFNINEKTKFKLGFGLVKQSTVFEPIDPNYQFSFYASAEQDIKDRLSLYLYSQYVTSPLNKPREFFDPFLYKNPLFIQTEMGTGLKANFNTINVDFQIITIYGTELNRINPMDSKIRINF